MAQNWYYAYKYKSDFEMEKATKVLAAAIEYYALFVVTCGYWIEMAEDIEVNDNLEKIGKHALVVLKLLFFK